jgi:TonB family protein
MTGFRTLGSGLSLLGTLFHLGVVVGMDPTRHDGRFGHREPHIDGGGYRAPHFIGLWRPHFENLGEGRLGFRGSRCPGRQQAGTPFRIAELPLPKGYDPLAFPSSDIVACVWLDSGGSVQGARLVNGTGSPVLDRSLVRTLYRQWRFVPAVGEAAAPGWQRVRLNSTAEARFDPPRPSPHPSFLRL